MDNLLPQQVVCFVSVANIDEFVGGVDRVACSLIRYFKSRGYKVVSYYWEQYTNSAPSSSIDKSYRFPQENLYSEDNIEALIKIIKDESVSLVFDVSFLTRIHEICYIAKTQCGLRSILLYQGDARAYTKSLKDYQAEIVFNQKGVSSRIFQKLFRLIKYPFSFLQRYHSSIKFHQSNIAFSDAYVVLSERYKKRIIGMLGPEISSKIYSVPNAVIPFSSREKKKQVIFVGRMDWQKRVDRLLRIWKKVSSKLPEWDLVIVGDGPYKDRFVNYAKELELERYLFVGSCPARKFIEESSVLCLTSSYEGFGLTLVEAQSCGCVPIAFDSYDAVRDIIEDGTSGVLVSPFNERSYANSLVNLCQNESFRKNMTENCIKNAEKFSPEKIEQKWDFILSRLSVNG